MKSISARSASFLLLASLTSMAWCQDTRPNLLPLPPLPPAPGYAVAQTASNDALWGQPEPSPIPIVEPGLGGEQYLDAMKGGYEGTCNTIAGPCGGSCCCHNHYVYANALLMNRLLPGGFVTSVYGSGAQAINYCNQEFGGIWVGGFEVGTGWCFGCNCNQALELVYWGLYPATATTAATGTIDSMIDFNSLNYNGGNANLAFDNANIHQLESDYTFNSVEVNFVGNGLCGGPFGCGMCGCSNNAGSPWGFGYTLGFRYMNFSDRFLFSADTTDNAIDGDPTELNYLGQFNNNLFGFQMGSGISYTVSSSLTAYAIGKVGVYDNQVTGLQRVYGTLGNADINNGPFNGQDAVVRTASRASFAMSGQIDLGGRWAVTNNWSANFGYRLLGLSGVATGMDNFQTANFHDVNGMAFLDRDSSLLLHGFYAGATYCW